MNKDELRQRLALHRLWLDGEEGGKRADLSGAILKGATLMFADLWGADLSEADLSGANLKGADLCEADLSGADLRGAILERTNVDAVRGYRLINFIAGSTHRLNVYDAHLDVAHCGCWSGSLAELTKRVSEIYPDTNSNERISYDNAIQKLKAQKK